VSPALDLRHTVQELGGLCLDFLVRDPEQLMRFMTVTGYDPAGLRKAVGSAALASALIDHFASNEALLLAFCSSVSMRPEEFMRVYWKLNPGG
jgi:hypothetical protein